MFERFFTRWIVAVFLIVAPAAPLWAQDPPSMLGTWRSIHPAQTGKGFTTIEVEFRFTEQQGALFNGTYVWRLPQSGDVTMHDGSGEGWMGEERVIGVIGWDNASITLADTGDDGHFQGRLVNDRVMELVYFEAGAHAAVARGAWVREVAAPE